MNEEIHNKPNPCLEGKPNFKWVVLFFIILMLAVVWGLSARGQSCNVQSMRNTPLGDTVPCDYGGPLF